MAQYDSSIRINTKIETKEASSQILALENRIIKAANKVAALRSKMDALKDTKIPTQEYKEIAAQIEKAEQKFDKLLGKQERMQSEGKDNGVAWQRLNDQMDEIGNEIRYAKGELQDLVDTGKAFTLGSDTGEFAKLGQQLQYAENDLESLRLRHEELISKQKETSGEYKKLGSNARQALRSAGKFLSSSKDKAISFGRALKNVAIKILPSMNKSVKKTDGLLSNFSSRFKSLALSLVFFNQISKGFNAAVSAIKEGIGNLAQYSEDTNRSISRLLTKSSMLKNNLAAAFSPILDVVSPILVRFIELLNEATEKFNQFLSALTGKKTFIKAVEIQKDYADSLKDTSEETESAANETKKALAPFDDLRQIQFEQNKESGKTENKTNGLEPSQMFETVDIASDIQGFVGKILDLFERGDFSSIGEIIARKINGAISALSSLIDWNNVGSRISDVVSKFVNMFNSLVSTIDWDALGRMIGKGINTIVNTLYLLINGIDWVMLGAALATGLNGMIYEVDWVKFGSLLGSFVQAKIDSVYGFVTNSDWPAIGRALGDGFMGLINRIDWKRFGETLGKTLSGIVSSVHSFIQTIDWKGLGDKISDTLNSFFASANWAELGQTFSDFALGLLDMLQRAIAGTDWEAVGAGLGEFLSNIDWWGIFTGIINIIILALGGVVKGAWGALKEVAGSLWEGFVQGISDFFKNPNSWIKENMVDPFMEGTEAMFGINGGDVANSIFMMLTGQTLVQSLINGIKNGMQNLSPTISVLAQKIKDGFSSAFEGVKKIAENAVNGVIDVLNKLKFDIPDWVPGIGGKSFGFNIKRVSFTTGYSSAGRSQNFSSLASYASIPYQIPRLATGTVVPPNKEFMAVLGDNTKEHEVVSPISTIKQAVIEAMKEGGMSSGERDIQIQLVLNDRVFGQAVYRANNQEKQRVGVRMVSGNA